MIRLSQLRIQQVFNKNFNLFKKFDTITIFNRQYRGKALCEDPVKNYPLNFIDKKNIFYSPHGNIDVPEGAYLHDVVWKNVDKWWNKTAMICSVSGRSYTYGQLRKLSGKFATSLRKLNIKPRETLAVVVPNIPEFAIFILGASEAGIRLTLINPAFTPREMKIHIENSEAVAVATVSNRLQVVTESLGGVSSIRCAPIVVENGDDFCPTGCINFDDLVGDGVLEFEKSGEKIGIDAARDIALLFHSSGTTGVPKGVAITHRNLVANMGNFSHKNCQIFRPAGRGFQEIVPIVLPLFHAYGFSVVLGPALSAGAKIISIPTFSSNNFLKILDENRATKFFIVAPILQLMINDPRFKKKHVENSDLFFSSAGFISHEILEKLRPKFGDHFIFSQGYGMSETTSVMTMGGKNIPGTSVGRLMPNMEMRIVGRSEENLGKNLSINETGEILVRGPLVMKNYFKNLEATRNIMEENWLKTGDLGSFDENGNLSINGRIKELIKVNGMQVSPCELENLLQAHDKIADVAVIGVPHEKSGEVPKAFVVKKTGVSICPEEIKKYLAERVVQYKRLGQIVFIQEIPKGTSGKILRNKLRNME